MQQQLQIKFHGLEPSQAIETRIREKVTELERFWHYITSFRVTVEAPHHHKHKGNPFRVRLGIHLPDKELVVAHTNDDNRAHEDVYVAIRDAFAAAARQLETYSQRRQRDVKQHGRQARELQEGDLGRSVGYD